MQLSETSILCRTPQGQAELLAETTALKPVARTLLGLVTGYTDLHTLADLLRVDEILVCAQQLIDDGFVVHVQDRATTRPQWFAEATHAKRKKSSAGQSPI